MSATNAHHTSQREASENSASKNSTSENSAPSGRFSEALRWQRTRLIRLPQPRLWGLWIVLLSAIVLSLGLYAVQSQSFTVDELTVDQDLSRHHDGLLNVIALTLGNVFSPVGGVLIIAAVCLFLLIVRHSPVNAVAFGGVAAFGWLASQFFKVIVERPRPNPSLLVDPLAPETGSNSFPSGHVALVVALAWAFYFLARKTPWAKVAAVIGVSMALAVAASRIYIGVHYPSDVIASFLAATAGVMLFVGLWNAFGVRIIIHIPLLKRYGPLKASSHEGGVNA